MTAKIVPLRRTGTVAGRRIPHWHPGFDDTARADRSGESSEPGPSTHGIPTGPVGDPPIERQTVLRLVGSDGDNPSPDAA